MAESCSLVDCLGFFNDSVYFKEKTALDADSFTCSRPEARHLCYSRENQYLILNSAGQLEIKNLTSAELLQPESKFNIMIYKESSKVPRRGRPVMLYANNNRKKMVVCCCNYEIQMEEMDPPQRIHEGHHKALFYLVSLSTSCSYMFQSTLHPNRFLAFERDNGVLKLVLREKQDEVDERCSFSLGSG